MRIEFSAHSTNFCEFVSLTSLCAGATKMEFNLKHKNHAVGQTSYHLVWKTKYSYLIFQSNAYRKVYEGDLRQVDINYGFYIYELQVMPEHIHIFVDLPSTM